MSGRTPAEQNHPTPHRGGLRRGITGPRAPGGKLAMAPVLAVGSGLALWLAFPTLNLWPLAILGVALLALATRGTGLWRGFGLGLLCGLAFFIPVLSWSGTYVGALPWFALATLESLYFGLLGAASGLLQDVRRPLIRRTGLGRPRVRPLVIAILWVAQEWLRSTTPFGGFPWARLAFSQADSPLLHLAAWLGVPGVTFGVALAGGVLAAGLAHFLEATTGHGITARLAVAIPTMAALVGITALPGLIPTPVQGPPAAVMGVQGNVPRAGLDFNTQRRAVLDNHARLTEVAAASVRAGDGQRPDLVVWPENASDIDPLRNADAARVIRDAVAAIGAPVIVGAVLEEPSPKVSNASLLYVPGSGVVDRYVKQHPVPFAEYVPYRSFFRQFSSKVDLVTRDFTAGRETGIFRVPSRRAGTIVAAPVICFEVAYDGLMRDAVGQGANLLVVQTNNATFGYTAESEQQLAISRLRAVEHGRSVVHVSTVGVSALITPDGAAHQRSALFTPTLLSGDLPVRSQTTVADHLGPWPERLAGAAAGLLIVTGLVRRRANGSGRWATPTSRMV
ncbi:apolipoprotein N-acyltransferase [Segeticoccus rhizosphaerae]|uniref:apolipoprotein N-acyltransferase n=1 Tax=Segeticoccus rhizosphaerae TaxID=1104777 RepID=UPI001EE4A5A5|nr:apolipoprotein N-acyltransferase [Ornithinicoccus soli]